MAYSQKRYEDMSRNGFLKILRQEDGDIIISVGSSDMKTTSVEFCSSGGQSPKTLCALRNLLKAIEEDNEDCPQNRH